MKILVLVLFLIIFLSSGCLTQDDVDKLCFQDEVCVTIERALTSEERASGLMHRELLKEGNGMLFVFEVDGIYPFWMKNTLIPLDIIWINQSKKIVDIQQAVPCSEDPCDRYIPKETAIYVLEVNKGFTMSNNITIGDLVVFN